MDNFVEAIKEGEIIRILESQALEEDLFILRKVIEPVEERVFEFPVEKKEIKKQFSPSSHLESWRASRPEYRKNNVTSELVDNFQWIISKRRRFKGVSRLHLAESIGVSEEEIKSIEFGELPKDDFVLISKIEKYLGIDLRKGGRKEEVKLSDLQKMNEQKIREKEDRKRTFEEGVLGNEIDLDE